MQRPQFNELNPFQFVILVLSLFVLAAIGIELVVDLPPEMSRVLGWIDNGVCAVFFIDFVIRFRAAESKLAFMKWGWIDLLASIPAIESLRWARIFRVVRILRLLRAVRSLRALLEILFRNRTGDGVASVSMITFLVLALCSSGILLAERSPESSIVTAEDAVWWSITTITTVGYGDLYPVTLPGRLIAAALMFTGVGLFGTLSGVIAGFFLGGRKREEEAPAAASADVTTRLEALRAEVAALRAEREG